MSFAGTYGAFLLFCRDGAMCLVELAQQMEGTEVFIDLRDALAEGGGIDLACGALLDGCGSAVQEAAIVGCGRWCYGLIRHASKYGNFEEMIGKVGRVVSRWRGRG